MSLLYGMNISKLHHPTEHVYWLDPDENTDRPIMGAVVGERGTLIVEAGNSPAHANLFLGELTRLKLAPPTFLTATHWHWDHVFGASAIDLPFITHRETRKVIAEMAQLEWSDEALEQRVAEGTEIEFCRDMMKQEFSEAERMVLEIKTPDIGFTTQLDLDLGGVTCQIVHVGGDHGSDNSVVYIPEDRLIFLGDCMYENLYHVPIHYTKQKLFSLIEQLLDFDAELYLFGHSEEPMLRTEMISYTSRLKRICNTVEHFEGQREAIVTELQTIGGTPLSEDDFEYIDAFIAGFNIKMPRRNPSRVSNGF